MNKSKVKKEVKDWLDHPQRILVGGFAIGVGGWLLYKVGKNIFSAIARNDAENQLDDNPAVRQATLLRNAMNPSGIPFMMSFDKTNEDMIYETAKQISNLDEVNKAYRKLYGSSLMQDLQNELDSKEYQKFLTLISSSPAKTGGAAPVTFAKKAQLIVAKKAVYVRKTPDATYHGAVYENKANNNIIYQANAGAFIGYATGIQQFDVKNNVKFIQVAFTVVKAADLPAAYKHYAGKAFSAWVSSSTDYVDKFDNEQIMIQKYPKTAVDIKYKKPQDNNTGVKGFSGGKLVITTMPAMVLDNNLRPLVKVENNTLLGEFMGSMDTGRKQYVKFKTLDNTERWIDRQTIKTIEQ